MWTTSTLFEMFYYDRNIMWTQYPTPGTTKAACRPNLNKSDKINKTLRDMGQFSNFKDPRRPTLAPDHGQLIRNAALAIRVALGSGWNSPGDAVRTVANDRNRAKVGNAISTTENKQPNWEKDVLDPLLETCLNTYSRIDHDRKPVAYTVTVVLLTYDIIRQRNAVPTQADYAFFESAFDKFLSRDTSLAIRDIVDAENKKCSGLDIGFAHVHALFILESMLTEAMIRSEQKNGPADDTPSKTTIPTSIASSGTSSPPQDRIVLARDVHIQYYLKPGCALKVNSVTSIDLDGEELMLETSAGRRVRIAEGVIVSDVEGKSRTVEIRAPTADGFELSATAIIPPGNNYTVDDVTSVERVDEMEDWCALETAKATIWVGNGPYMYERSGTTVTVKNVFNWG
jgi:hypothetical protein